MAMSRSAGGEVVHAPAGDDDIACRRLLEAGDHAKRRRLAAAGWAEQADDLAGGDGQIDVA